MIGLVTIGQAPRDDVVESMFGQDAGNTYVQAGALDYLEDAQILDLTPAEDEHPLVTRLRDGTEVVIAKERLTDLMNDAIARVEDEGATLTCVLCTGEFSGLTSRSQLVYPDRVLASVVGRIGVGGVLGVLIPNEGQRRGMLRKWGLPGRRVELAVASPYTGASEISGAASELVDRGAQYIVLDCMGYTSAMLQDVRSTVSVPVMLASRLVGAELMSR